MNFRTLDLNLLRVFDLVMEERNVTRAASRLAMTQPAVSNALRRLREATHEDLFVPSSVGVTPTPHAHALWPTVRAAIDSLRHLFEPEDFDPLQDRRCFTLAMADATTAVWMPPVLEEIQRQRSAIEVRVLSLASRDPRPLLEQGQADVALGFFPEVAVELSADGDAGNARLEPLYDCEYVGVSRRGHRLEKDALSLDGYCAAEHVRVSYAGRRRGYVDEELARLGRQRRVVLTVNNFSNAANVVHRSDLLSVLPRSFVRATGLQSQLAVHTLPFALPSIHVSMLWHRRHERDAAQRWWRSVLQTAGQAISEGMNPPLQA